ncbi:MAG: 6-phosphogluconolactonase [Rikenellaceae bacterium]
MKTRYSLPKDGGLIVENTPVDVIKGHEKISTNVFQSEGEGAEYLADIIVSMIDKHNKEVDYNSFGVDVYDANLFVLGLSTGRTPKGLYRELVRRYKNGEVSFKNVQVLSIDEFYPVNSTDMHSRNRLIHEIFLNEVDIDPNNIHTLDGTIASDRLSEYCARYDKLAKNIDLLVVGMGEQGQIGFNEAGTFEMSKTRLVKLSHNSRKVQKGVLPNHSTIPHYAITMGMQTIINAKRIALMAWGEQKSEIVKRVVEGEITTQIPASILQSHPAVEIAIDYAAADRLTRESAPWLVGECDWTPKFIRKAVIWLCGIVGKPILKLSYNDYVENSLGSLLEVTDKSYDTINIEVFNDLQHTITGWPGGKPNADDSTRPVASSPFPKKVLIFSPHPDDDVISMGGTFIRLVEQGHDVNVAYMVSGNVAVHDDVVLQNFEAAYEIGFENRYAEVKALIDSKSGDKPKSEKLLKFKGAIRRAEAKAACRSFGMDADNNCHFLNLPFYETGAIKKGEVSQDDINIIVEKLREVKPNQIYAAGDLADPHGTHRVCFEALLEALDIVREDDWMAKCNLWLYRGAWMEWDLGMVDMAVPLSPQELIQKRHAIYRHLSQKDIVPFPGDDSREFWQRAEDRTQNTAYMYNNLGMAEYQAIEVFVKMF